MDITHTFPRSELLAVARDELRLAEHHLPTARAIKADGSDAHCEDYWEREVRPPPREGGGPSPRTRPGPLVQEVPEGSHRHHPRRQRAAALRAPLPDPTGASGPDRGMACGPVVRLCEQCGAAGQITVTDAGDFCACGAEVTA